MCACGYVFVCMRASWCGCADKGGHLEGVGFAGSPRKQAKGACDRGVKMGALPARSDPALTDPAEIDTAEPGAA